jgi:hypothetical protein
MCREPRVGLAPVLRGHALANLGSGLASVSAGRVWPFLGEADASRRRSAQLKQDDFVRLADAFIIERGEAEAALNAARAVSDDRLQRQRTAR